MANAPIVSAEALSDAYDADSLGNKAVNACVLLHPLMQWAPNVVHPPLVAFLVPLQAAQSASLYAVNVVCAGRHAYFNANLGFPFKYLANRLGRWRSPRVGFAIALANSLTMNARPSLSRAK